MPAESIQIESFFAEHCDEVICNIWYKVISKYSAQHHQWPVSWKTIWSVWRHLWMWRNDGIAALWLCSNEDLQEFESCLERIGEKLAAQYIRDSISSIGEAKLTDGKFVLSPEFEAASKEWNNGSPLYWSDILPSIAAFVRKHRIDATEIIEELKSGV